MISEVVASYYIHILLVTNYNFIADFFDMCNRDLPRRLSFNKSGSKCKKYRTAMTSATYSSNLSKISSTF